MTRVLAEILVVFRHEGRLRSCPLVEGPNTGWRLVKVQF